MNIDTKYHITLKRINHKNNFCDEKYSNKSEKLSKAI